MTGPSAIVLSGDVDKRRTARALVHETEEKMASVHVCDEEFLVGDDFDVILSLLEEDVLNGEEELVAQVNEIVNEVDFPPPAAGFKCDICDKVCKSQRGLTRHNTAKHNEHQSSNDAESSTKKARKEKQEAEEILHPLYFMKYVNESAKKLSLEEVYSEKTRQTFHSYELTLDQARQSYEHFRELIVTFKGDVEKFLPKFYHILKVDGVFHGLGSGKIPHLLGAEVAMHVVSHLTKSEVRKEVLAFTQPNFSQKDMDVIRYLSGYVISTVYRRLYRKKVQSELGVECKDLLLAAKSTTADENTLKHSDLIKIKDRGGLWCVTDDVFQIFVCTERAFREEVAKMQSRECKQRPKIEAEKLVHMLMSDSLIICYFNKWRNSCTEKIKKEAALNLLDYVFTLYVRTRAFSHTKGMQQQHKIATKRKKSRSLRTEIKKASNSLDQGH